MSARLKVAVRGNLEAYMRADAASLARVHTNIVRTAGFRTQKGIKKQIRQQFSDADAFQGTIRVVSNPPRGFSTRTTVRVLSKSNYKRGRGKRLQSFNLLELYTRSETVVAGRVKWLAIPTKAVPFRKGEGVGRGGTQRRESPDETGLKLKFVKKDENKAFLFHFPGRGAAPILMYVLVRQVIRSARLNPDAIHRQTLSRMAEEMQKIFIREDQRMRREFGVGMSMVEDL